MVVAGNVSNVKSHIMSQATQKKGYALKRAYNINPSLSDGMYSGMDIGGRMDCCDY